MAAVLGAGGLGVELEVRHFASVTAAVDHAYGMLDGLDVLVNNAGIGMRSVNGVTGHLIFRRRLAAGAGQPGGAVRPPRPRR